MKKHRNQAILLSIGIACTSFATLASSPNANAAAGSCSFPTGYGWAGSICEGVHKTTLPVTSASWPYSGTLVGPCVGAYSQSNVSWNPNSTYPQWQYLSGDDC